MAALVDARELFAVYPSKAGGVAALQGLTLSVDREEICVVLMTQLLPSSTWPIRRELRTLVYSALEHANA